jgi:flavin-dependent dehydrogenase
MSEPSFDIGIIGGGPAGAAMGAYLGKAGLKCVVFERELFPRPHVGESLVPSSTRVFRELDFLDQMEAHAFPHKAGAVWTTSSSRRQFEHSWEGMEVANADVRFNEREQPGVHQDYTYHVDRGLFDLLLLQHANRLGASVYEGVRVQGVDFSGEFPEIHFPMGRKDVGVKVRMVVDASGRNTTLGHQLKLKGRDPVFDQYALHTWFEGYDRRSVLQDPGREDYIYVHFLPLTNSWVWQIPITPRVTSIGVVTQKKHFAASRQSREAFFWECLANRPELYEGVRNSRQLRPLKDEGDYSYAMTQICGDKFVLIGDAARFVDPIFSTGVSIALNSARFASRDVLAAAEAGDFGKDRFRTYETTIRRGTNNWYEFISIYYRLNILFTAFVNDRRYRLDVLRLLQGDVYDEDQPEVLRAMRQVATEVEENESHPWHALLGDLTANAFRPCGSNLANAAGAGGR